MLDLSISPQTPPGNVQNVQYANWSAERATSTDPFQITAAALLKGSPRERDYSSSGH